MALRSIRSKGRFGRFLWGLSSGQEWVAFVSVRFGEKRSGWESVAFFFSVKLGEAFGSGRAAFGPISGTFWFGPIGMDTQAFGLVTDGGVFGQILGKAFGLGVGGCIRSDQWSRLSLE